MISARARPLARSTRYEAGHAQEVNTRERISFSLNRRFGYRRSRKADMRAYQEAGCKGAYQEGGYAHQESGYEAYEDSGYAHQESGYA